MSQSPMPPPPVGHIVHSQPPPPGSPWIPEFRVVALGGSGSGKTVFLASMYRQLFFASGGRPYSIETDFESSRQLQRVYDQVVDTTSNDWPSGTTTGDTREIFFDCVVDTAQERHRVLRISYLDYAGELFDRTDPEASPIARELEQKISSAHALFGVLDGSRLVEFLRNGNDGKAYLAGINLPILSLLKKARCPVHLLVSKWDIVRDFGEPAAAADEERLEIVKSRLLDHPEIGGLVQHDKPGSRSIRLIPISAVGDGFATIRNGVVEKVEGAAIGSFNVDLPLSAVVPDFFTHVVSDFTERDRNLILNRAHKAVKPRSSKRLYRALSLAAQTSISLLAFSFPAAPVAPLQPAVQMLFSWMVETMGGHTSAPTGRTLGTLGPEAVEARRVVLDAFEAAIDDLERTMPSSVLRRETIE